jgi:WD40 repeat protein
VRLPDLVAYQAAVQHPTTAFSDPELRAATVTTGRLGLPRAVAGNFAVTYQLRQAGRRWAVRCFHRDAADRAQRYAAISSTLHALGSSALVEIAYLPTGVRVGQGWYPVTKMPWVDGLTFNRAIEERLARPAALRDLERRFVQLVDDLRHHGIAHGDLQHGNILVDPSGALRLVDYDGMYVPALHGLKASETGDPNYQHPGRRDQFDADLDRFSALVVVVALRALAAQPGLWQTYNTDDNLLFRRADFAAPSSSALISDLKGLLATRDLTTRLAQVCVDDYARVPSLDDFLQRSTPRTAPTVSMSTLHASILNRLYGPRLPETRAPAQKGQRSREPGAQRPSVSLPQAILNRLYAAPRAAHRPRPARRSPSTAGPRYWKVRRAVAQEALAFSADGRFLVTADRGGKVCVRDVASGRTCGTWKQPARVVALACSASGDQVAVLGADGGLVRRRLAPNGSLLPDSAAGGPPKISMPIVRFAHMSFGLAGVVVASSGGGPEIRVWDAARVRELGRCTAAVCSLAMTVDGGLVAAGGVDGSVRCWSVATGALVGAATQAAPVVALAISPDGSRLASSSSGLGVQLRALPGGRAIDQLPTREPILRLAFSPDGKRLAGSTRSGQVITWDLGSLRELPQIGAPGGQLTGLAFSPDGGSLAAISGDGVISVRILDAPKPRGVPARQSRGRRASRQPVSALAPGGWLRSLLKRVAASP